MNSRRGEAPGNDPGLKIKWWNRVLLTAALAGVGWSSTVDAASAANADLRYGGPSSWDISGPVGGPFTGTRFDAKIGNRSQAPLDWTATAPSFVQLSQSSGTLPPRTRFAVFGNLDAAAAAALPAGQHTGELRFHNNTTSEADIVIPVTLVIEAPSVSGIVTPATDFSSQGAAGGPFQPDSVTYTLTNTGGVPLPFAVDTADTWVTASPSTGTVAVGGSVDIAVAIQDPATTSLSNGVHPSSVTFTETSGNRTLATRLVSLNVQAGPPSAGWTVFTPSADTRIVYVSSSQGNDSNDGFSQATPKRTLGAARALLRNGYPDWMLLRSGDVWSESFSNGFGLSGRSATERMLVSSYGSGPRPRIQSGSGNVIAIWGQGDGNNVAFVGLHLWPHTYTGLNGSPRGLCVFGAVQNLLIEDCYFQAAETNIVIQGANEYPSATGRHRNIALRRNVIVDAFNTGSSNSQGIFASGTDGLLLEENVWDHNGWRDDVPGSGPTWYRHNIYIQNLNTGVVLRGNIVARTDGLHTRSGGVVEDNLLMNNALSMMLGGGGFPAIEANGVEVTARHNVVLDGGDLQSGSPRGWGWFQSNIRQSTVEYNIVAHNTSGHAPMPVFFDVANNGVGVQNTTFAHNVVYNWNGVSQINGNNSQIVNVTFSNNKFQNHITPEPLLTHSQSSSTVNFFSANNVFDTLATASSCMQVNGGNIPLSTWKPMVHDTTSVEQAAQFPDPNRTIATYHASIGGAGNLDAFMMEARQQSKANWRPQYTAAAVNDYIRAGFGL